MAKVELKNLTKKYGDVVAVQNMDLTIPHNEFLVLVGPSGCGKSTTLRMIAGLEEISGGEIFIGDQKVNEKSALRDIERQQSKTNENKNDIINNKCTITIIRVSNCQ